MRKLEKKYQLWLNYGCYEGWKLHEFDTIEECIAERKYGEEWVITKQVEIDFVDIEERDKTWNHVKDLEFKE